MAVTRRKKKTNPNKQRSGFLVMFLTLILLGSVIYYYRERFFILFDSGIHTVSKTQEPKNSKLFELINVIENNPFAKKNKEEKEVKKVEPPVKKESPPVKVQAQPTKVAQISPVKVQAQPAKVAQVSPAKVQVEPAKVQVEPAKVAQVTQQKKETIPNLKKKTVENKIVKTTATKQTQTLKIYFSKYDDNNGVIIIPAFRSLDTGNTPLTSALNVLLKGPTSDEINKNVITHVPQSTYLRQVYVKESVAFIDLSDEFENNPYGRESMLLQLKQIVYTATEFSSVKAVQFMINGQIKSYLGGDGIVISKPLRRYDFS